MASTVQGAVVGLLAADATLAALVPSGVFAGEEPGEKVLPFLLVKDAEDEHQWIYERSRIETHKVTVTCWAKVSPVVGAQNPAEAVMARVEALLNWDDLDLPNTVPIRFEQRRHSGALEQRRASDKGRVYKVERAWDVVFEQNL